MRSTATAVGGAALVVTAVVLLAACGDAESSGLASRTASVTASLPDAAVAAMQQPSVPA